MKNRLVSKQNKEQQSNAVVRIVTVLTPALVELSSSRGDDSLPIESR